MAVFWTVQARRHLRRALARELGREVEQAGAGAGIERPSGNGSGFCHNVLDVTMDRLNDILAATFPGMSVAVKDQVLGDRRDEDLYILMVESFGEDDAQETGPFVVKVGRESRIRKEIAGWAGCRPPGLRHDLVLLDLRAGERHEVDGEAWMSLVYGDAQQFLGVSATVPFEEAALDCIRSGSPRLNSVGFAIVQLFERIGHLLYSQAFVDDPAREDYVFDLPRLEESLTRWESDPACQAARREVNTSAGSGVEQFLDPVDYLRYIQKYVAWKEAQPDGMGEVRRPSVDRSEPELPGLPRPLPVHVIPRMLSGCAHGDLHGRNILVGIVRDQAMWPTVFNYEEMGARNLIGWDFVELETELKIRAHLEGFGGGNAAGFIHKVQSVEIALNVRTEQCHLDRDWPEPGCPSGSEGRLGDILLGIRRMAAQHLGASHGRPNDWLEEYYFLLTCYGAFTGRFEDHQHRERMAALISAGVAASRLSWPRNLGQPDPSPWIDLAAV